MVCAKPNGIHAPSLFAQSCEMKYRIIKYLLANDIEGRGSKDREEDEEEGGDRQKQGKERHHRHRE